MKGIDTPGQASDPRGAASLPTVPFDSLRFGVTTIGEALDSATRAIHAQRVSQTPLLDASLLLCSSTGLTREQLYAKSHVPLDQQTVDTYTTLVKRRCAAEPIAYLTGNRDFYGRTFSVSPAVLVPRPDTEVLVEQALAFLDHFDHPRVLDLCTGSGCIGISIAAEYPRAAVCLSDISLEAIEVARSNSHALLDREVEIVHSDLFSSLQDRRFHMIMTNPPYLTQAWYEGTEAQVKKEPSLALLGGDEDGLCIIRKIVQEAPDHLEDRGILIIECDYRQNSQVARLLEQRGFVDIESRDDLAHVRRIVWGALHV
jgi:release factor glutamine methyltransferase